MRSFPIRDDTGAAVALGTGVGVSSAGAEASAIMGSFRSNSTAEQITAAISTASSINME
jgi:hypothetical protein